MPVLANAALRRSLAFDQDAIARTLHEAGEALGRLAVYGDLQLLDRPELFPDMPELLDTALARLDAATAAVRAIKERTT